MEKPKLKRDWENRLVRLECEVTTLGGMIVTKGTIMRVMRNHGGLHLRAVTICKHCGIGEHFQIKGVPEGSVTLLPVIKGALQRAGQPSPSVLEHGEVLVSVVHGASATVDQILPDGVVLRHSSGTRKKNSWLSMRLWQRPQTERPRLYGEHKALIENTRRLVSAGARA